MKFMTVFPFKNKGQSEFSFNKTVIALRDEGIYRSTIALKLTLRQS